MNVSRIPGVALQLYTLRALGEDFGTMVRRAAAAGYAAVETFGPRHPDPGRAAQALAEAGVSVCSSHVALDELERDLREVCRTNLALGNDVVIVPWLPPELRGDTGAAWAGLGRRLGDLGRRCREEGVRLLYHNHDFELALVEGRAGLAWLAEAAAPEDLGLEPDLGWIARAGASPERWLADYAGRCPRVHVKDVAPASLPGRDGGAPPTLAGAATPGSGGEADEGGWADVGHGALDWARLLPACREAGAEFLVVEHDEPADPARSARRSADALRELL